jgi:hypothetical protein
MSYEGEGREGPRQDKTAKERTFLGRRGSQWAPKPSDVPPYIHSFHGFWLPTYIMWNHDTTFILIPFISPS